MNTKKYSQPWRKRIKRAQRKAVRYYGPGGRLGIGRPSALDTIFIASNECYRAICGYWREYYYKLYDRSYGRVMRGEV